MNNYVLSDEKLATMAPDQPFSPQPANFRNPTTLANGRALSLKKITKHIMTEMLVRYIEKDMTPISKITSETFRGMLR